MAKFNLNSLLSGASLGAGESNEKKTDHVLEIIQVSVYDLMPSEDNFYSVADIGELKDSIEMFGVKQNLTVKKTDDGKYKVIAGHRRRLASLALAEEGKKEFELVPCAVESELDEIREQLLLITTNATTRQLTDYEKTEQAKRLRELLERYKQKEKLPGRMRELIATTLNTSTAQVGRMESISKNLTAEFQEEFKEQKINISAAYEISTLPGQAQEEVYEEYKKNDKITINDVKEKKEAIKEIKPVGTILPIHDIVKEMSVSELAEFICDRCDGEGRFCDLAIECNNVAGAGREEICMRWLRMQGQKKG